MGRPAWPAAAAGLRLLAETAPEAYAGSAVRRRPAARPGRGVRVAARTCGRPRSTCCCRTATGRAPPPGLPAPAGDPAPYGRWLTAVFDRWWDADRRRTRVRLFEECVALLLGVPAATERLGLQPFTAVVVETDGAIEQVDSLKSAYEGAAATGMDVFRHSFDDVLAHPGVAARQAGPRPLCRAPAGPARWSRVCGGGHYAHRYRGRTGFGHPSVYCADLAHLVRHAAAPTRRRRARTGTGRPHPSRPAQEGPPHECDAAAPHCPDDVLRELGRTGSGPQALGLLVDHQRGRRLLVLRALLDAVRDRPGRKPAARCRRSGCCGTGGCWRPPSAPTPRRRGGSCTTR